MTKTQKKRLTVIPNKHVVIMVSRSTTNTPSSCCRCPPPRTSASLVESKHRRQTGSIGGACVGFPMTTGDGLHAMRSSSAHDVWSSSSSLEGEGGIISRLHIAHRAPTALLGPTEDETNKGVGRCSSAVAVEEDADADPPPPTGVPRAARE